MSTDFTDFFQEPALSADPVLVAQLEALDARRAAATLAKDRATLE